MTNRETTFSPDRLYRYSLWRKWDNNSLYVNFIGLNPSTADESIDDPTIRRCIAYSKAWGYGGFCMTNLFAWRDTSPENMKAVPNPVGVHNQHYILQCASEASVVVAGWGKHGKHHNQDINIKQLLNNIGVKLHCLKINGDGSPSHPLYLKGDLKPIRFI